MFYNVYRTSSRKTSRFLICADRNMEFRSYLQKGFLRARERLVGTAHGIDSTVERDFSDETASETVECLELRAGVSSRSCSYTFHHRSSSFSPSFPPFVQFHHAILLARSRRIDLSHAPTVPRYIDLSSSSSSTSAFLPPLLRFASAPSLSGSHYLLITSYLVTCYPFARRSSYGPIGCTQAC